MAIDRPDIETLRTARKPFAYFQWNYGWGHWEQVADEAAGEDGVVAAYLGPCDTEGEIERLNAEIARLREALTYYADDDYNGHNGSGACALAALAEQEPTT